METKTVVEQMQADISAALEKMSVAIAERDAAKAEFEAKISEANSTISILTAQVVERDSAIAKALADSVAATELAQQAEQRAKLAEGALARDPDALKLLNLPGAESAVEGTVAAEMKGEPKTWAEALAVCGGDYVTARRRYPQAFQNQFKK